MVQLLCSSLDAAVLCVWSKSGRIVSLTGVPVHSTPSITAHTVYCTRSKALNARSYRSTNPGLASTPGETVETTRVPRQADTDWVTDFSGNGCLEKCRRCEGRTKEIFPHRPSSNRGFGPKNKREGPLLRYSVVPSITLHGDSMSVYPLHQF